MYIITVGARCKMRVTLAPRGFAQSIGPPAKGMLLMGRSHVHNLGESLGVTNNSYSWWLTPFFTQIFWGRRGNPAK
jgi:hypothetical protein